MSADEQRWLAVYSYDGSEQSLCCDVDDTLVLWDKPQDGQETITIIDPYDGHPVTLVVHKPHVKLVKDRYARGCSVTVWSQSGPQWAKAVVDALGLQEHVTHVRAKPFAIVDDLPAEAWLNNRIYLKPQSKFGTL